MARPRNQVTKKLVVLVDDDPIIRRIIGATLQRTYDFESAETATEGLHLIMERRPQAILLDIDLPDVDGDDLMRTLRGLPGVRDVPIIAITGTEESANRERLLAAGFDAFIGKGDLGADLLLGTLTRLLQ